MGHVRVGELPKTLRWQELVTLISTAPNDVPAVASATAVAAQRRLRELATDPSLGHCFWVLTRLMAASRTDDFAGEVARLGLSVEPGESVVAFIARVSDFVRPELARHVESGPFSELASLALRRALTETVGATTPSLFGSSVDDLQRAFRQHSTTVTFGDAAKRFFGDFLARTLRFFIDKELSAHVGPGHMLGSGDAAVDFKQALDTHARQSARIMERFAGEWYSKHNWESQGAISRTESDGFVAYALTKLRRELRRQAVRA